MSSVPFPCIEEKIQILVSLNLVPRHLQLQTQNQFPCSTCLSLKKIVVQVRILAMIYIHSLYLSESHFTELEYKLCVCVWNPRA